MQHAAALLATRHTMATKNAPASSAPPASSLTPEMLAAVAALAANPAALAAVMGGAPAAPAAVAPPVAPVAPVAAVAPRTRVVVSKEGRGKSADVNMTPDVVNAIRAMPNVDLIIPGDKNVDENGAEIKTYKKYVLKNDGMNFTLYNSASITRLRSIVATWQKILALLESK